LTGVKAKNILSEMKLHPFCICVLIVLSAGAGRAELLGYAEARGFGLAGVSAGDKMNYIILERVRPTFTDDLEPVPHTSLTVTAQLYFQQGRNHPEIEEMDDYLTIERLYLDSFFESFDLRIGRQAVNWGSALIWNPTDLFREVFLTDYWAERKGINAAKFYVPLSGNSHLTAVVATGDTSGVDNRYGLKLGTTWKESDLAAVFMDDTVSDRLVWGLDIKGQFKIGYWLEAAWFAPKDKDLDEHLEAVVGVDYSFPVKGGLILQAQYYHDGSGEKLREDYDWMAVLANTRFGLAEDYASIMASLAWDEEVSMALLGISNLDDSTWIITPYLNMTLPHDLQLNIGANIPLGPEPGEFRPGDKPEELTDDPLLQTALSEYLPELPESVYYIWLRWSY